jgi:hypothetical protein
VFLVGWIGVLCACRLRFLWVCLVGFFLSFFGLFFFVFQHCVFSYILPVYYGAPDTFNKTRLLLIKKKISQLEHVRKWTLIYPQWSWSIYF